MPHPPGTAALPLLLLLLLLQHAPPASAQPASLTPSHTYTRPAVRLNNYSTLYHDANPFANTVHLALIVTDAAAIAAASAPNWLGIGIGEPSSGSMPGSDILTAHFAANATSTCTIVDRHVPFVASPLSVSPSVFPFPDACPTPDWTLVRCARDITANSMLLEVSRPLSARDNVQDRRVEPGLITLLTAHGGTFSYHGGNRHSLDIVLYTTPETVHHITDEAALPDDVDGFEDLRFEDYLIPQQDTTYAATSFRIPRAPGTSRMIIAVEPLFSSPDHGMVHHYVLYLCAGDEYARLTRGTIDTEKKPYGPLGNSLANCSTVVYGWAKGMGRTVYPDDVGVIVDDTKPYLVLETHFDNPTGSAETLDNSGVRIHYTDTMRHHIAGSLFLGDPLVSRQPHGVETDVEYQNTCSSDCTRRMAQPVTLFSSFLHMHVTGKKIFTNRFDANGTFIDNISKVNFWSDRFQKTRPLPFIKFNPGEVLQTTCTYDTSKLPSTRFGIRTRDEMCLDIMMYYPVQTDAITKHELNLCAYYEDRSQQSTTVCGAHGMVEDFFSANSSSFPQEPNPTFNDTVGSPETFGSEKVVPCKAAETDGPKFSTEPTETEEPEGENETATESAEPEGENEIRTASPTPTKSSESIVEPEEPTCFPASQTVRTRGGQSVRMDALQIGDIVAVGGEKFSSVIAFTHRETTVRHSGFVALLLESNLTLTLTGGHYLYVNEADRAAAARDVRVGDTLFSDNGGPVRVCEVRHGVSDSGLLNPQTMHGDIVVGGVVCSTFTEAVDAVTATALLSPIRWVAAVSSSAASLLWVCRFAAAVVLRVSDVVRQMV